MIFELAQEEESSANPLKSNERNRIKRKTPFALLLVSKL
jgi:hypothetical protein